MSRLYVYDLKEEFHCPVCSEPINYYPPDSVGFCSGDCGYSTEQGD